MKITKKIIAIILAFAILTASLVFSVSASEEDFTMRSFDKGYITFVFDDGRMPFTQAMADLFIEYGMPMSAATIANKVTEGNELYNELVKIEENGGEILSHGYAHKAITSSTADVVGIYTAEAIEKELGDSWRYLNNLGFDVNGMIQVGNGGSESTADFALVESIARKYYKYSNGSGTSAQYVKARRAMSWDTLDGIKSLIDSIAENKEWRVFYAHDFDEITSDSASDDDSTMREILQYIADKNGSIEVTTWRDMYNNFGEYTGPQCPTEEALSTLNNRNYYVGYGGTGDGSSYEKMAPNVQTAIKTINANGLKTGDTANVWIVQDIDSANKADLSDTSKSPKHNLAYWGGTEAHTAKIVVQPYSENQKANSSLKTTYLALGANVSSQEQIILGGPTEFKNLQLVYCSSSNVRAHANTGTAKIIANGYDLTIGEGVTYGYIDHNGTNGDNWTGYITPKAFLDTALVDTAGTYDKPMTMTIKSGFSADENSIEIPALGRNGTDNYVFKENVTVEYDNSGINGYLRVGTVAATNTTTFEKNLNFRMTNTGAVRFNPGASNIVVKGGVQFIVKGSLNQNASYKYDAINNWVKENGTDKADIWLLNVTGETDFINFTNEKGKFKLEKGVIAVATPVSGGSAINSSEDILDLSSATGEYNVELTIKCRDYYVKGGGTGDGSSPAQPTNSVANAISAIEAMGDVEEGEEVNIWIMQDASDIGTNGATSPKHDLAYIGTLPEYTTKVRIRAYKGNTYPGDLKETVLFFSQGMGSQAPFIANGPIVFDDVKLVYDSKSNNGSTDNNKWDCFNINGCDVEFTANTTFGYINANGLNTYSEGQFNQVGWPSTITEYLTDMEYMQMAFATPDKIYNKSFEVTFGNSMLNAVTQRIEFPGNNESNAATYTFNKDVTIAITGKEYLPAFRFGGPATGMNSNILGNMNFRLTPHTSKSIRFFTGLSDINVSGAVQVIDNGTTFATNGDSESSLENVSTIKANQTWYLNVKNNYNQIDFIEGQKGKFQLTSGFVATATAKNGGKVYMSDKSGLLDLSEASGEYDVDISITAAKLTDFYVQYGGTGDGTSVTNPAPNVATAIQTINDYGLTDGDTANIYIMQDIAKAQLMGEANSVSGKYAPHNLTSWDGTVEHQAKIIVQPYSKNQQVNTNITETYLAISQNVGQDTVMVMGGPTEFRNLRIVYPYGANLGKYSIIFANGHDLVMGEGVTYGYLPHRSDNEQNFDGTITTTADNGQNLLLATALGEPGSYDNAFKLEFNNKIYYQTTGMIDVPAREKGDYVFNNDATLSFGGTHYGGYVKFGTLDSGATVTFNKNLNFKFTTNQIVRFYKDSFSNNVVVKGGLQFIVSDTSKFGLGSTPTSHSIDNITNIVDENGNQADRWYINVPSADIGTVDFVEGQTGKFRAVKSGLVGVATRTDVEGGIPVIANSSGIIDL